MALAKPQKFAHIVYRIRQLEKMLDGYATVFGAAVQHRDPVLAFVTYDDEHHRMAFENLEAVDPEHKLRDERGAVGVDHVAYTFGSLRELLENHAELKSRGITPYWTLHHGFPASIDGESIGDAKFPMPAGPVAPSRRGPSGRSSTAHWSG